MKIGIVGPFALYPKGTVSVRTMSMAKALRERGHMVAVFLPPYDNKKHSGKKFRIDGIDVCNVKIPKTESPINYLLVSTRLAIGVLLFRPHVIHVFKPKGYSGLAAMLLIFFRKIRLIRTPIVVDSDDWEGLEGFGVFYREHAAYSKMTVKFFDFQERWIVRRVDAITVASRTLERQMSLIRVPKHRVFYIPNGPHDHPSFKAASDDSRMVRDKLGIGHHPLMLLYTRFLEFKTERVIELFLKTREKLKAIRLLVVGKGLFNEEDHFMQQVRQHHLEDSVIYVGWVRPEELPSYLAAGDVAIYPYDDNILNRAKCPGKLVELMSQGKAIVAEGVGQICEYITDEESGILVPPNHVEMFAEKVLELLRDRNLRRKPEINARQRIFQQFDWDVMINEVLRAYEVAIEKAL